MTAKLEVTSDAPGVSANPSRDGRTHALNQIVSFSLGEESYGLNIMKVQEIILIGQITQMPQAPDYVRGLINLRGHVIPIIDLRRRFGMPDVEKTESQRIVVVNVNERTMGLVVDAVDQVLRVRTEDVEPAPSGVTRGQRDFIAGLVKLEDRIVILLDVERLLAEGEAATCTTTSDDKAA